QTLPPPQLEVQIPEVQIEDRCSPQLTHPRAGSAPQNSDRSQPQLALEPEWWSEAVGLEQAPKLPAERRSWFGMRRD
ncbi:hypothetical protein OAE83_00855, partial [bacterium]|nr:hypothetical protein [bacterium]